MDAVRDAVRRVGRDGGALPASTCSSCTPRTATCCRPSSRRSPISAPTNMAAASRTACAIRSRCSARCARRGPRRSRSRCASRRNDWVGDDGVTPPRTRSRSRGMLQEAGRRHLRRLRRPDLDPRRKPVYGRMFQTPFSDRIRNETGMATMAVGNIYEPDHVNSILMAGPRRPRLPRPAAPGRPLLDAACGRRRSATAAQNGPSPTCPAATSSTGWPSASDAMAARSEMHSPARHALVTGGGTRRRRARSRWRSPKPARAVTICGRRPEPAGRRGRRASGHRRRRSPMSPTKPPWRSFTGGAQSERGPVDIVVANAGAAASAPFARTELADWQRSAGRQPDRRLL